MTLPSLPLPPFPPHPRPHLRNEPTSKLSREERLRKIQRIFLDPSEKLIKSITEAERYHLRARKMKPANSTCHDTDNSEDYNPSLGEIESQLKRKRKDVSDDAVEDDAKRSRSGSPVVIGEGVVMTQAFIDSLPPCEDFLDGEGGEDAMDVDAVEQQTSEPGKAAEAKEIGCGSVQGLEGLEGRSRNGDDELGLDTGIETNDGEKQLEDEAAKDSGEQATANSIKGPSVGGESVSQTCQSMTSADKENPSTSDPRGSSENAGPCASDVLANDGLAQSEKVILSSEDSETSNLEIRDLKCQAPKEKRVMTVESDETVDQVSPSGSANIEAGANRRVDEASDVEATNEISANNCLVNGQPQARALVQALDEPNKPDSSLGGNPTAIEPANDTPAQEGCPESKQSQVLCIKPAGNLGKRHKDSRSLNAGSGIHATNETSFQADSLEGKQSQTAVVETPKRSESRNNSGGTLGAHSNDRPMTDKPAESKQQHTNIDQKSDASSDDYSAVKVYAKEVEEQRAKDTGSSNEPNDKPLEDTSVAQGSSREPSKSKKSDIREITKFDRPKDNTKGQETGSNFSLSESGNMKQAPIAVTQNAAVQDNAADQPASDQHVSTPEPCLWCDDFAYGLVGFQPEVDQGPMCSSCKEQRASVNRCLGHHIIPLQGINPESFDFKAAYGTLCPAFAGTRVNRNKWCSLCPTPAFFECATQPAAGNDKTGDRKATEGADHGCGLLLCEPCNILIRAFKNIALVVAKNKMEDPVDGVRADIGFLLPGSGIYVNTGESEII